MLSALHGGAQNAHRRLRSTANASTHHTRGIARRDSLELSWRRQQKLIFQNRERFSKQISQIQTAQIAAGVSHQSVPKGPMEQLNKKNSRQKALVGCRGCRRRGPKVNQWLRSNLGKETQPWWIRSSQRTVSLLIPRSGWLPKSRGDRAAARR